jgi:hypothetical protein
MHVTVSQAHKTSYQAPLELSAGAQVLCMERVSEWPGWIWCRSEEASGSQGALEGWIPEAFLARRGTTGTLTRDYSAYELTAQTGEVLEVLEEESGWYWCRNQDGKLGWIPIANTLHKRSPND